MRLKTVKYIVLIVILLLTASLSIAQDAPTVVVATPWLAQAGTQLMVEAFEAVRW